MSHDLPQSRAVCLAMALLALCFATSCRADHKQLIDAGYVVRKGMPNFLMKVAGKQPVTVAFIGGSITQSRDGYSKQVPQWMAEHFKRSDIRTINAGVGGTNSHFGAFRVGRDVLVHQPDVVFVEFAVNDGNLPDWLITQGMEGIVRHIWREQPTTDVCFVYTLNTPMIESLLAGNVPHTIATVETIAEHYGIPSIYMGVDVIQQIRDDKMIIRGKGTEDEQGRAVYSHDGTHPLDETGHRLYTATVAKAIEAMAHVGSPGRHALPEPLDAKNMERATIVPIDPAKHLRGEWQKLAADDPAIKRLGTDTPTYYRGSPGASVLVHFKGTAVGLCNIMGPDTGKVTLSVDGKQTRTFTAFDAYCTYYRASSIMDLSRLPDGEHTATFTAVDGDIDKAKILAVRSQTIDDAAHFAQTNLYISGIMLIGELSDAPTP